MENYENIPQYPEEEPVTVNEPVFAASSYEAEPTEETEPEMIYEDSFYDAPASKKKHGMFWKTLGLSLLIAVLVVGGAGASTYAVTQYWGVQYNAALTNMQISFQKELDKKDAQIKELQEKVEDNSYTGQGNSISGTLSPDGLTPGQVHAQNKNCVVGIANHVTTNIFGQATETASSGSGFLISENGYIVTNYHVIEGATTLTVITNGEEEYPATVVGYDEGNDFALIKIDVTGFPYVKLGSSDDLIVGDQVVAIGNPLGEITTSLTVGYISVKDRDVTIDNTIINMLQTDTAINPGNSGGPLFNMKGEVIGITTAKYSGTAVESIGFAIPIDDVAGMIQELLEKGYLSTPYMGVNINNSRDGVGVYVVSVSADSPAAQAGLQKGDIIVGLGEYETSNLSSLDKVLRNFEPGQTTAIYVYRNRTVLELSITFGEKPQSVVTNPTP